MTLTKRLDSDCQLLSPAPTSGLVPGTLRHSALIHATVCAAGGADLQLEGGPVHFLQPRGALVMEFLGGSAQAHGTVLLHASHKLRLRLASWEAPKFHGQETLSPIGLAEKG